ncbi:MAG: hypothetical protein COB69_05635 [Phycisphaera sp.]|nr:MAG: hypothetical protein COB69_05635 [Phycisphaera sp.]
MLLIAGSALAQPQSDPALADPSLETIAEELKNAGEKAVGIKPTRDAGVAPIRPHAELGLPPVDGRLLPEGSFIVQLNGLVHAASQGAWIFEPTDLIDESKIKPMIVLPSQTLTRLIQIVGLSAEHNKVALTGEVLLYRGRNYLLITAITTKAADETETEPAQEPTDVTDNLDLEDPLSQSVRDLISELENARHAERTILQPVTANIGSGRAPVPEGRTFMRRTARLTYLAAGEIAITFDNDPDFVIEAPLVVLPCHLLEQMELIVESHGDALPVRVSGQSYAYNGRSFIKPTSIVIQRAAQLDTRQ